MKKTLPALFVLCILAVAGTAGALETDELIAITTMPLAVADVMALPDVPRDDVITVVTTLNQAAVPAPQFVEIVRYVPVALVEPAEPRFVTYVTQEYERGIVGEPLALAIADRYDTYGIDDADVLHPPVLTVVERQEILPPVVVTRFQPVEFDPLALVAMPLAVAAVADIVDVPRTDLMRLVASLNQALVPAPQFVEVVRYSPVVLVDRSASPQFVQFVTAEVDRGLIGRPLAFAIADRIDSYEPIDIDVTDPRPRLIVERDEILPPVVVTRVARAHPHGGPPGQLKKALGLRTGAEVVHRPVPDRVTRSRTLEVRGDVLRHEDSRKRRVTQERRRPRELRGDDSRERRSVTRERRVRSNEVRSSDDGRRSRARVTRPDRSDRGQTRVRQERRSPTKKARVLSEQRSGETHVSAAPSRGNSAAVKQHGGNRGSGGGQENRGDSGRGKGNGKGKGKG